jgi:hypothetical protein
LFAFAAFDKRLNVISKPPGDQWSSHEWTALPMQVSILPGLPLTKTISLPDDARIAVDPLSYATSALAITVQGEDGRFYAGSLRLGSNEVEWSELAIPTGSLPVAPQRFVVVDGVIFAFDSSNRLWAAGVHYPVGEPPQFICLQLDPGNRFEYSPLASPAAIGVDSVLRKVLVLASDGAVWTCDYFHGSPVPEWTRLGAFNDFRASPSAAIRLTKTDYDRVDVAVADDFGRVFTTHWTRSNTWQAAGNWTLLSGTRLPSPFSSRGVDQDPTAGAPHEVWLASRVDGVLELFALDSDEILWKRWWS